MAWEFKREETEFEVLPEGQYRISIKSAEKAISKSGNDMLALQFEVSGSNTILYHYIVFMNDRPEITNRMLTQFFDSFKDIPEGDFNMQNWIGKVGACKVKHDEYNGKETAKVSYFIHKDKQDDLPPWKEPSNTEEGKRLYDTSADGFIDVPKGIEGDLPF